MVPTVSRVLRLCPTLGDTATHCALVQATAIKGETKGMALPWASSGATEMGDRVLAETVATMEPYTCAPTSDELAAITAKLRALPYVTGVRPTWVHSGLRDYRVLLVDVRDSSTAAIHELVRIQWDWLDEHPTKYFDFEMHRD